MEGNIFHYVGMLYLRYAQALDDLAQALADREELTQENHSLRNQVEELEGKLAKKTRKGGTRG